MQSFIPCPDCSTQVPIETDELLRGVKFSCPRCKIQISLAQESVFVTANALKQYSALLKESEQSQRSHAATP